MKIAIDLRFLQGRYFGSYQRYVFSLISSMLEIDMVNRYKFIYEQGKDAIGALKFVNSEDFFIGGIVSDKAKQVGLVVDYSHIIFIDRVDQRLWSCDKKLMLFTNELSLGNFLGNNSSVVPEISLFIVPTGYMAKILMSFGVDKALIVVARPSVSRESLVAKLALEDVRTIKSSLGLPAEYFLYLGKVDSGRNLDILIKMVESARSNINLVLAGPLGDGYESLLKKMSSSSMKDHFFYIGELDDKTKQAVLSYAKGLLLPQTNTDFSYSMLEAFAFNVPVVAAATFSIASFAGGSCLLVDSNCLEEWLFAVEAITSDEQARSIHIFWQKEYFKRYNIKGVAKEVLLNIK